LPCLATTTYLAAESAGELEDWCSALKTLCVPQMVRSPKVAKLREVRTLHLTISEAHRLPLKLVPNPYCVISFNNVRVAKTKVKVGPDPVYDEEFELDDIPPDVITVTVTVWNKGSEAKTLKWPSLLSSWLACATLPRWKTGTSSLELHPSASGVP
jgi:Ras GTPase-activating protein 1